ncbi:hypothetical protein ANANG_G00149260 [Anguilla anguilla]|uniref:Uncharacterized protein n=1 Tax=Anguilla anguilla TaxID=7936 RepID=A0A9D3M7L8_ANGAN|nr:hypothetical protein ANANG_G00149260 [Anguilla anguilla]
MCWQASKSPYNFFILFSPGTSKSCRLTSSSLDEVNESLGSDDHVAGDSCVKSPSSSAPRWPTPSSRTRACSPGTAARPGCSPGCWGWARPTGTLKGKKEQSGRLNNQASLIRRALGTAFVEVGQRNREWGQVYYECVCVGGGCKLYPSSHTHTEYSGLKLL